MFELLTTFVGGGGLGLVLGLAKKIITGRQEAKAEAKRLDIEVRLAEVQAKSVQEELRLQKDLKVIEQETATMTQDAATLMSAIRAESKVAGKDIKVSLWVHNLRASLRPIITYIALGYSVVLTTVSVFVPFTAQAFELARFMNSLSGTVVGFWFGDRSRGK